MVFLLCYLFVVSTFAFFHFILGYQFNVIEIWVQENIWIILFFAKLLSFFFIYQYWSVQRFLSSLFQQYFSYFVKVPTYKLYVALIFLLIFFIIQLQPQYNRDWSLLGTLIHLLGNSVYLLIDFFLVSYLVEENPMASKGDWLFTCLFACLVLGTMSYIIVPSRENFSIFFVFQFLLMLVHYHQQRSWLAALWTLMIFNNVLSIFLSLDMFYEEKLGLFYCTEELDRGKMILVFILGFCYLRGWKTLKFWQHS